MPRLPIPGSDDGQWGLILNDYLSSSLDAQGNIKNAALSGAGAELTANKGGANGYAPLDGTGKVPPVNLPAGNAGTLAGDSDVSIAGPMPNQILAYNGSAWANTAPIISSVAGKTGTVTLDESDITNLTSDLANAVNKGSLILNVKDYGANGTGGDDSVAIATAISAAAGMTYGSTVYFPPGYYKTAGGHILPPNVSVMGAGMHAVTIEHTGLNTFCFQIGPSPVQGSPAPDYTNKISDFKLLGQLGSNSATQIGIYIFNCIFYNLENIYVKFCEDSFRFDGGVGGSDPTDTFAGLGYAMNLHSVNSLIGYHFMNWITDTTLIHCYAYGSGTGSKGYYLEGKTDTCNFISPSVEGLETGYHISTVPTLAGVVWISPREESCTTPVLWDNGANGHTIIGASASETGISSPWFPMTAAANNAQICFDGYFTSVISLPTASASQQGAIFRIRGSPGVSDSLNVCMLNSDGSYSWKNLLA